MKSNKFSRALNQLKSTKLDEKIERLNEAPTNNISSVYSLNQPGFRLGPKDPERIFYPDVDGNWPAGIPGTPGERTYVRPAGYWDSGPGSVPAVDWDQSISLDFSHTDDKSTDGFIDPTTGTVLVSLPPNSSNFILGPLVDGYNYNHGYDDFTNIGYIQKDTRQFVLLGRVQGYWKSGVSGLISGFNSYREWDGNSSGFTAYNPNFTLEMAQWFRDQYIANKFVSNVSYYYSGGYFQSDNTDPTAPPGTKGGAVAGAGTGASVGANGSFPYGSGGNPNIGTPQDPYRGGDPKDAGFPWGLFNDLRDLLFGKKKKKPGEDDYYGPAFGDDSKANLERDKNIREIEDRMDEYGDDPKVKQAVKDWNDGLHNAGGGDAAETKGQTRDEVIQQGRENLGLPRTQYFAKDFDHDYEYDYYKMGGGDAAARKGKTKKEIQVQGQVNSRMDGHWMNPNTWKNNPEKAILDLIDDAMMVGPGSGSNAIRFAQTTRALRAVQGINGVKTTSQIIKNIPGRYTSSRGAGAPRPPKFSDTAREVWNTKIGKYETITPKDGIRWDWSQRTLSDDLFNHYTKTGEMPSGLDGWNVAKAFTPSMMKTGPTPNAARGVGALVGGGVVAASELGAPRPAKGSTPTNTPTQFASPEEQISKPESVSDIETILNTSELPQSEPNQQIVSPQYSATAAISNLANAKEMGGAWTTGRLSGMSLDQVNKFFAGTNVDTNLIYSDINRIKSLDSRIARLGADTRSDNYDAIVKLSQERSDLYKNIEANLSGSASYVKPVIEPPKNPNDPQLIKNVEASLKQLEIDNQQLKGEALKRNLAFAADLGLDILTVITLLSPIPGDEAAVITAQATKAGVKTASKTTATNAVKKALADPKKAKKIQQAVDDGLMTLDDIINLPISKGGNLNPPGTLRPKNIKNNLRMDYQSYEPVGEVITESHKRILREIKNPVIVPEIPKQKLKKYRPNFAGKYSPQNTPDVTACKESDDSVKAQNAAGQTWRTKDKYWSRYQSTERMNIIYDNVGHGDQYWDTIVNENQSKKKNRDRKIQEYFNVIAHEKAMLAEDPNYISPFKQNIDEQETLNAPNDPLIKRIRSKLSTQINYQDKPSPMGYPDGPTPEQINGWHPEYAKRTNYYNRLDPQSADAMPATGDPEIDQKVAAQKTQPPLLQRVNKRRKQSSKPNS